ncbi:MAG TPA: carboxypeptidase-like regulatory domain-containing protein [Vicinamibacterales bacterium]|nr:carboxypeptidase-like regulatory domain-containing protein [Vicinamibacterales bacterium]
MPNRFRHFAVAAVLGLGLLFASCDKSRPSPTGPLIVTPVRLALIAPAEIAPGESVQLTANAIKSDGSVENVSSQAQWTPTTSEIVQVSSTGLATGKTRGEQFVSARFFGLSAIARILVLPRGTFRVTGTVRESGFEIANATLTVISGIGEGLTTVSRSDGSYAFYGVSGPVQIQAKKDGYLTGTQRLDVTAHRTYDFDLAPDRARNDYRGIYTLTIAASSCGPGQSTFPDAARRRVYTANVTQEGARLTVTLSDADFIVTKGRGNSFVGFLDPTDMIKFFLSRDSYYYYHFDGDHIVERFDAGALVVSGIASARGTATAISGTLPGAILIASRQTPPFGPFGSRCIDTHGFEMVRR